MPKELKVYYERLQLHSSDTRAVSSHSTLRVCDKPQRPKSRISVIQVGSTEEAGVWSKKGGVLDEIDRKLCEDLRGIAQIEAEVFKVNNRTLAVMLHGFLFMLLCMWCACLVCMVVLSALVFA